MMKLVRSPEFNLVTSAVVAAAVTAFAYAGLGFLGVALVGLVILFAAAQSDLHSETFQGLIAMERMRPDERRARRAEGAGMARFWKLARRLGLALTILGTAGFVLIQLPR